MGVRKKNVKLLSDTRFILYVPFYFMQLMFNRRSAPEHF